MVATFLCWCCGASDLASFLESLVFSRDARRVLRPGRDLWMPCLLLVEQLKVDLYFFAFRPAPVSFPSILARMALPVEDGRCDETPCSVLGAHAKSFPVCLVALIVVLGCIKHSGSCCMRLHV